MNVRRIAISCCLLLASVAANAQERKVLSVEALLKAPTVAAYSPAAFSPDMRYLAYVVTDNARRPNIDENELHASGVGWYGVGSDIFITDLTSGQRRNLTKGKGHNWAPIWSADSQYLAFLSGEDRGTKVGPARLWAWHRPTDEVRQVSDADVREGFAGLQWASDGVVVSLFPEELGREGFSALIQGKPVGKKDSDGPTVTIFEFIPSKKDEVPMLDQINLDLFRRDVGVINVETGKLRKLITRSRVSHYRVSPDGRKLAYTVVSRPESAGTGQYLFDLFVQDMATGQTRNVAKDLPLTLLADSFSWSPNSETIAWRTGGPTAKDEVCVVSANGRTPAKQVAQKPAGAELSRLFEVPPPAWGPLGRHVFFTSDKKLWRASLDGAPATVFATFPDHEIEIIAPRQQRFWSSDQGKTAIVMTSDPGTKRVGFARINFETGAVSSLFEEERRYGGYETEPTISPDGASVAFIREDAGHPADFFIARDDMKQPRQVSEVAPALSNLAFGRAEVLEWRSIDGDILHGALVYPGGYEAGKKYPLIVKIYGGSSVSNDLNRFGFAIAPIENMQIYANRGYAVLLADSKLNVGTPMVDLMKSVMPGINKAIEKGVADPDRIGVTGHSYGGYSTLALITQSPRFKAAVMRAGQGNMISGYGHLAPDGTNYGLQWSEGGQGRMGGSPWEFRERYLENSPIFYLDRVQTPLLIIHGSKDDAVPVFLADEVFTGLRRLGKPVTYARYEGEGHWEGGWSYANQIDVLERTLNFFDKHLKSTP